MNGRIKRTEKINKLSIIGKIKIGEKVINQNGKSYPRSLDYFKADGEHKSKFEKAYPGKPTCIQIIFPSDDSKEVCNERYEIWKGTNIYGYGDGETFHVWSEEKNKYKQQVVADKDEFFQKTEQEINRGIKDYKIQWKCVLTLRFLLLEIKGILGAWELTTRGPASSIPNIVGVFDMVKELGGTVTRMIFDLQVKMVNSHKMGEQKKYPVLSLVPNMSAENLTKLKSFIGNSELPFIITEEVLKDLENKQIEYNENENVIDAEIVDSTMNEQEQIIKLFDSCQSFPELNKTINEIKKMQNYDNLKKSILDYQAQTVERLKNKIK